MTHAALLWDGMAARHCDQTVLQAKIPSVALFAPGIGIGAIYIEFIAFRLDEIVACIIWKAMDEIAFGSFFEAVGISDVISDRVAFCIVKDAGDFDKRQFFAGVVLGGDADLAVFPFGSDLDFGGGTN